MGKTDVRAEREAEDGRLDMQIKSMNAAFYQLDEALRKILNEELEFDIIGQALRRSGAAEKIEKE